MRQETTKEINTCNFVMTGVAVMATIKDEQEDRAYAAVCSLLNLRAT